MWDLGINFDIDGLIYQLIKKEEDQKKNYQFIQDLINQSDDLYFLRNVILILNQDKNSKKTVKKLIASDKIDDLQKIYAKKIENLIQKKKISPSMPNFLEIIFSYLSWGDKTKLNNYLKQITKTNKQFLEFIKLFAYEGSSQYVGDYGARTIKKLNKKEIAKLLGIKLVLDRMKKITKNSNLYQKNNQDIDWIFTELKKQNEED
jgi:hypothetical protein